MYTLVVSDTLFVAGKMKDERKKEALAASNSPVRSPKRRNFSALGPVPVLGDELAEMDEDALRTHFVAVFGGWNVEVEVQVKAILEARKEAYVGSPNDSEHQESWSEMDTSEMDEDELRTYFAMLAGGWNLFVESKVKEALALRKLMK